MKSGSTGLILAFVACLAVSPAAVADHRETLLAADFVKTKEGHFEDYLRFLKANWVSARKEARKQGYVGSYRILTIPSDGEWDVVLMTEYPTMERYNAREQNFKRIFERLRPNGPILINGLGSRDLADIKFSKLFTEIPNR